MKPLAGRIAVVAGATRGAGRAIAVSLGEAGATVYVTGRSVRGNPSSMGRPETIEETAELVTARGGTGIAVRVDHTVEREVQQLFEQVDREQSGRLDILVNDVWGGDGLTEWGKPFWEQKLADALAMQRAAVQSHIITSHYGIPMMIANKSGLVIEITDGVDYKYRGNLYYSLAKVSVIHLAEGMAAELQSYGITAVAVTPGFLRSEAMLEHFGVAESNWQDGAKLDPHFIASETPYYIGRGIAAFAADPDACLHTGEVLSSWSLSDKYGIQDVDGTRPHWGNYFKQHFPNS